MTDLTIITTFITFTLLLGAILCRYDRNERNEQQPTTTTHPVTRKPAVRCGTCGQLIRYHNHPNGRNDALTLHTQYECSKQTAAKENS